MCSFCAVDYEKEPTEFNKEEYIKSIIQGMKDGKFANVGIGSERIYNKYI